VPYLSASAATFQQRSSQSAFGADTGGSRACAIFVGDSNLLLDSEQSSVRASTAAFRSNLTEPLNYQTDVTASFIVMSVCGGRLTSSFHFPERQAGCFREEF
jgi:hypothetical protein